MTKEEMQDGQWQKQLAWKKKTDVVISQANPTSAYPYLVLPATNKPCRIVSIMASVTWTVQPTPLDVIVSIDGVSITFTVANPLTATGYYGNWKADTVDTAQLLATAAVAANVVGMGFLLEGKNIAIAARTTGGTVQNLDCRVKYQVLED